MGLESFNLVSPGVQVEEIDNSQLPKNPAKIGPAVIGRTRRGPALKPITVQSFSEFVEIFGDPVPGTQVGDVWRDGNLQAPTYAAYAAQAWLKNSNPLTVVRLLGAEHDDANTAGEAGWKTDNDLGGALTKGGAYGLYIFNGSSKSSLTQPTGTLAAVWYFDEGAIGLAGTPADGITGFTGSASTCFSGSTSADYEFTAVINKSGSAPSEIISFNFNRTSDRYIRKVFNTNPCFVNDEITNQGSVVRYWLGETYDKSLKDLLGDSSNASTFGVIVGMKAGSTELHDHKMQLSPSKTGWVFGQFFGGAYVGAYQPQDQQKLFRFVSHDNGEWDQNNLKISIKNIKASQNDFYEYGTFTVEVRSITDNDGAVNALETFTDCNLDPSSKNYIAKKIGDMYQTWDYTKNNYRNYGEFPNNSKFIRVEMDSSVKGADARLLPFGFYGPLRWKDRTASVTNGTGSYNVAVCPFTGGVGVIYGAYDTAVVRQLPASNTTYTIKHPGLTLRVSSSSGDLRSQKDAYFGVVTTRTEASARKEESYSDFVRAFPKGIDSFAPSAFTEYSFIFTLEDISSSADNGTYGKYVSGSAIAGNSICAAANNYTAILDQEYNRFTMPLFGGFDGVNIKEADPFNNRVLGVLGAPMTNYAYNSVKLAIDSLADSEVVETNMIVAPGITNDALNIHILNTCENRRDSLAIIDIKDVFLPDHEAYATTFADRFPNGVNSVSSMVTNIKALGVNSSYGATYAPWVKIQDTISDVQLWVPPSVVALGTYAYTERNAELWFAPAGFTRGGLTEGAGGVPVLQVSEKLRQKDRDDLYKVNVNSIASFPAQGIVVYGNKTLQVTPSALDRINVRRLMNYIKKEISRKASVLLFEPNIKVTWNRFIGDVEPLLRSVKSRFGVNDFKLILDETTTTAAAIDRNIMYAKIYIKPTKAIEYIMLDFNIMPEGASFED